MILVTGPTGNVGRHVVSQLISTGTAVRALTRDPEKIALLPAEVEGVSADLSQPDTLPSTLQGITSVFLYAVPGSVTGFIKVALASGVRRVVFLSSAVVRDGVEQQTNAIAAIHADIEQVLEKSGLEWTFVRPGALAVNALQWAQQIHADGGVVYGPYAQATAAPVHEADIAAVVVDALTTDLHIGARLLVTGPESLTRSDEVRIIGEVSRRDLRFQEIPPEAARQQMVQFMPEPMVDALLAVWAQSVGQPATVSPTVEEVTGRPARSFRQWVVDHVGDFD